MAKKHRILKGVAIVGLMAVASVIIFLIQVALPILNGYTAKVFSSSVFVSGRSVESVVAEDVAAYIGYQQWELDREKKSVTISSLGFAARTAVYHPAFGAVLLPRGSSSLGFDTAIENEPMSSLDGELPWPKGDGAVVSQLTDEERTALKTAVDWAFEEPGELPTRRTRAVLVVQGGNLIAERYAEGFTRDTPLLGWSMSKSITSALVGVLVGAGKLDMEAPAPVPEWKEAGDPRSEITLDMLLRMSSGLDFEEDYGNPLGDALNMLFLSEDFGGFTAQRPLAFPPDTHWSYSSGTSNLVSRIIRQTVGGSQSDYVNFPQEVLFHPIGMRSVVIEPDPSGIFVGSSYTYATARDWARFGLLYLHYYYMIYYLLFLHLLRILL